LVNQGTKFVGVLPNGKVVEQTTERKITYYV